MSLALDVKEISDEELAAASLNAFAAAAAAASAFLVTAVDSFTEAIAFDASAAFAAAFASLAAFFADLTAEEIRELV